MGESSLGVLEIEKKYSEKFSSVLNQLISAESVILLSDFLKAKTSIKNTDKIVGDIVGLIESTIYGYIEYYAVMQYLYMDKTGEWTEAGEDRVKSSFFAVLNSFPADKDLNYSDYSFSQDKINQLAVLYKVDSLNKEELSNRIKSPTFDILGLSFSFTETAKLNKLLAIVSSQRRVIMGLSGSYISMIFALATTVKYHEYEIHILYKEEIRTPNAVNYIVAVIDQNQIAIRREVCEYIFYKKWLPVVEDEPFFLSFMNGNLENQVAEAIKKQVMQAYSVNNKEELLEVKDDFINKMMENFSYHEVSHDILDDFNLTKEESSMVTAISVQEENILTVMTEVLTEWMPGSLHLKGPMKNIVDTAVKNGNNSKARQLLLTYMSDGWFLDTDTEFMHSYTYLMFAPLLKCLKLDSEIDFIELYGELNSIFDFFLTWYRNTIADVLVKLKKMEYVDTDKEILDYDSFNKRVEKCMRIYNELINKNLSDDIIISQNWINFFSQMKSLSPHNFESISSLISDKEQQLYKDLILKFGGEESALKYGDDIRSFVLDGMISRGFSIPLE
ncbi:MAG: hypothetical protein PHF25_00405 [Candidatus Margulisbacteria bacterium]|nr:hypothetical protein [Candidatus Margulisiibacteriota bacterium]